MVKLDIISDPICPWCYIGKTNLDKALEQFEIDDDRHPEQMADIVKNMGLEVVWKDWDRAITSVE